MRYSNPVEVRVAEEPSDVRPLLRQVDQWTAEGLTAIGFVTYEAASSFDAALDHHAPDGPLPLAAFACFMTGEPVSLPGQPALLNLVTELDREGFDRAVDRIHNWQKAGDTYQVNFTQRWSGPVHADPLQVFSTLQRAQASTRSILIETGDYAICSASPELFFAREGHEIRCEPMKGTRPRGRYREEDVAFHDELYNSEKDRAENLMIVDMIRNDLGRVATPGTVQVRDLFQLKGYPTVWQQVSTVTATVHQGLDDIFAALFPCASVTGAPRCRTMQIIRELETSPRGVYTGAVGIVRPGGDALFNVAIRTLMIDKRTGTGVYGVGGGIVWDSTAEEEWQECRSKAAVLTQQIPDFQLLETMKADAEGIYLQALHLDRMARSAEQLGFEFDRDVVMAELARVIARPDVQTSAVRLRLLLDRAGNIEVQVLPLPETRPPVHLKLAAEPVSSSNLFLFHKTTHRTVYEDARTGVEDCDDVILFNERGELTETTISNLFLEIDGRLVTPHLDAGLLPGTFRQHLLDTGQATEAVLTLPDLQRADVIMTGNSVRGLQQAIYCD